MIARRFLIGLGFIFLVKISSALGSATNVYITQTGSPSGQCTTNVQTPAFFNTAANWGSGSTQIGPGTTVLICGTFTGAAGATEFSFQGSGSTGNPVILLFDANAVLTAPYWSANGAISCSGLQYILVNGGANGTIENTANGSGLTYEQTSIGVLGANCYNSQVENLTIKNIYINQGSSSGATDINGQSTAGIEFTGTSTNNAINGNTISQAKTGVLVSADANADASNLQIYGNNISDIDWGVNVGGGDAGDTLTNVVIHDNTITNWTNWQFPTATYHQDGIIVYNFATGSVPFSGMFYNNYIYGDLGVGSPTGFIYCAQNASCEMFNNLLVNTGHVIYGIIWDGTHLSGSKIYNNTIIGIASDLAITLGTAVKTSAASQVAIQNNIVLGPNVGIHDYSTLTSDVSVSDYNVWRTASGTSPQMATNDSTFVSYANWKAGGFDAASTNADPKLSAITL